MKFSEDQTVHFVQLYRKHECLWNTHTLLYRNKQAREAALQIIVQKLKVTGFGVAEAKHKIKNLRSTYAQEIIKIERSKQSGVAFEDVYKPAMKWFTIMDSFIKTVMAKKSKQSSLENLTNDDSTPDTPKTTEKIAQVFTEDDSSEDEHDAVLQTKKPKQNISMCPIKSKKSHLNEITKAVKELKELNRANQRQSADEYAIFGKHVATQLRQLSTESFIIAQEKIQNVITRCRLQDLHEVTSPALSKYAPRSVSPLDETSTSTISLFTPTPSHHGDVMSPNFKDVISDFEQKFITEL